MTRAERHAADGAFCVAAVLAAAIVATLLWAAETENGKGKTHDGYERKRD